MNILTHIRASREAQPGLTKVEDLYVVLQGTPSAEDQAELVAFASTPNEGILTGNPQAVHQLVHRLGQRVGDTLKTMYALSLLRDADGRQVFGLSHRGTQAVVTLLVPASVVSNAVVAIPDEAGNAVADTSADAFESDDSASVDGGQTDTDTGQKDDDEKDDADTDKGDADGGQQPTAPAEGVNEGPSNPVGEQSKAPAEQPDEKPAAEPVTEPAKPATKPVSKPTPPKAK